MLDVAGHARAAASADATIPLADGLFRCGGSLELDGRITWFPRDLRGRVAANVYLLTAGRKALLVDTGLPVHEAHLLAELVELVPSDGELSVMPTRAAEFDSIGNLAAVLSGLPVRRVWSQLIDASTIVAFDPRFGLPPAETDTSWPPEAGVDWRTFEPGDTLDWADGRAVELVRTPLRLLITVWPYDPETRTLFTSDCFSHVLADGRTVVTAADEDATTVDDVVRLLRGGKLDWLARADTRPIRDGVAAIFAARGVERIAPSYGAVLAGRAVVERHVELLLEALDRVAGSA